MEISIHSLMEGAERATGSVAIIDVFPRLHHGCRRLGKWGHENRDGAIG
jgi:hypothetical protein